MPDPFLQPEVTDLWESVAETLGDASVARTVIQQMARSFWNMPWSTWQDLAKAPPT